MTLRFSLQSSLVFDPFEVQTGAFYVLNSFEFITLFFSLTGAYFL